VTAQLYVLYLTVILAVIVPPGPTAVLCMSHGARYGAWASGATVLGGVAAALSLMLLSALGLGAAIAASKPAFMVIQWAGAAYLVYLGLSHWRAPALAQALPPGEPLAEPTHKPLTSLFATGWIVGVSNPKDLLFFGALFPQFLNPAQALAPQLAVLGLTWVVAEGLVMAAYAVGGARLMRSFAQWGGGQWFNRVTGAVFLVLAAVMLASHGLLPLP
jgi:homoserine/homoserine lactone efflux protein